MSNIMKKVDILDLIKVNIGAGLVPGEGAEVRVALEPYDVAKKVVVDEAALQRLNNNITEKAKGMQLKHPNTLKYIEEFVSKMISELYRNGLVELVDIPDAPDDPYGTVRKIERP